MRSIQKIKHEIEVANTFIERDEQTARELRAALEELGDVEAEITHWRVIQSRERKPVSVIPLHLNDKKIEAEALRETIRATEEIIEANRAKIAALEEELAQAQEQAFKGSWATVCDKARAICKDLESARVAYLDASKRLYALHQTAKPGEFFPPDVVSHYAPDFKNTLKRPYDIATGLDMTTWKHELGPIREQTIAWRAALIENPEAEYPST